MEQVAFPALIHSLKVQMSYGDKEGTLVIKFRPEGDSVERLNALVAEDMSVMVGIVPVALTRENNVISKRSKRKPQGKEEGGEV